MSGPVHVRSVAAIERFRLALTEFEKRAQNALETLNSELRRATEWLDSDSPAYWKEQEKKASDVVQQAKLDLERCLIFPVGGEQPSCREEKAILRAARDRLDHCRQKRQDVRRWRGVVQHEVFEFRGRIGQLRRLLETDLPRARAKLQLIIRRIEGYSIEAPPEAKSYEQFGPSADG